MERTVTAQLAAGIATLGTTKLPAAVISKARDCLLDSLGCMIGGSRVPEVRGAVDLVLDWGQKTEAAVPGLEGRYPVALAAYAAAQFANALDFDDTVIGVGHPGAPIFGTALMLGQTMRASGMELIRAAVAGYEAAVRVGRGISRTREREMKVRGHSWAIFGAVGAASSLLRLNAEQIEVAFALATRHAAVPFVGKWYDRPISPLKNNYGWAALGGLLAATMAADGVRDVRGVLDGEKGFWIMASSDRWRPELVLDGLGSDFAVLDVEFKPYASCRYIHWPLGALREILDNHPVNPSSVRSIVVGAAERANIFADYHPRTLLDFQFSLPYVFAATLLGRPLTSFDPDDRELASLAQMVGIETDPEAEQRATFANLSATVEVELADGERLKGRCEVAPGDPSRPLTTQEMREKFLDLAAPALGAQGAQRLYHMVHDLPELPPAGELAGAFQLK